MNTAAHPSNPPFPYFRRDLGVKKISRPLGSVYEVADPVSGEVYEFDEQTYHLCQSFDGFSDAQAVINRFNALYSVSISREDLEEYIAQANGSGLLENATPATLAAFRNDAGAEPEAASRTARKSGDDLGDEDLEADETEENYKQRWTLADPCGAFRLAAHVAGLFRPLFLLMVYGLVIAVPVSIYTLIENERLLFKDLAVVGQSTTYLTHILFTLLFMSIVRSIVQGVMISHYGGCTHELQIRLRFGLIPEFVISKKAIRDFDRHGKLWTYGSNLLFRLVLIVAGTMTWYWFRGTGTQLAANAIIVTHSALLTFILLCAPLRSTDGYKWLVTYFRLPSKMILMAIRVFVAVVTRRPLPATTTPIERRRLFLYAVVLITFWTWGFFRIASHIASGVINTFPTIFGEATQFIIGLTVTLLLIRWAFNKFIKSRQDKIRKGYAAQLDPALYPEYLAGEKTGSAKRWNERIVLIFFIIAALVVLFLPYPYRIGGTVLLLPPEQQAIQSPVSGQIAEVMFQGGDGHLLEAGATVALIVSTELENTILTLQDQISEQTSELNKARAQLDNLLAEPRMEEIEGAQSRLAQAREEVKLAERQLEVAKVTSQHSDQELKRIRELPKGVVSELQIATAEKQADVDRLMIKEKATNVSAKQEAANVAESQIITLLRGVPKEEIDAARHNVAAAEATSRRTQQNLSYAQSRVSTGRLTMPFDGYLVDSYLMQKKGTYLREGGTFAMVQTRRNPMVEFTVQEYDVPSVRVGGAAEVKLMAYPDAPFHGPVVSVDPAGAKDLLGQTFKVVVELTSVPNPIKPGMSGYGKIEAGVKPMYVLLTMPLLRFIEIEIWSWFP